jgi:outer membrane lipoprotein SlyB
VIWEAARRVEGEHPPKRFTMNATLIQPAAAQRASFRPASDAIKPLWAAVGVLGVCVVAMGATLVQVNQRPAEPLAQAALPLRSAQAMTKPTTFSAMLAEPPADTAKAKSEGKPAPVSVRSNTSAPSSPAPAEAAQAQPKPACANCGTVESVTPITREGQGSGVGVVAGGVLGGVVGNQIGKGNGRAATTVIGAIGGGWAGNAIEKNMKKTTAYSVRVRMQDGSSRVIEQSSSPMVGGKVTVEGNVLRAV